MNIFKAHFRLAACMTACVVTPAVAQNSAKDIQTIDRTDPLLQPGGADPASRPVNDRNDNAAKINNPEGDRLDYGAAAVDEALVDMDAASPGEHRPSRARFSTLYALYSVNERPRPVHEPIGIKAGGFTIYPTLNVQSYFSSNIYKQPEAKADYILDPMAQILVRSNWGRHFVTLKADADHSIHARHSREDATNAHFIGSGRLDIHSGSYLTGEVEADLLTVDRGAAGENLNTLKPVRYNIGRAQIGGVLSLGTLSLSGDGEIARFDYYNARDLDNAPVDEQFRDYTRYIVSFTPDYYLGATQSLFATVQGEWRRYDKPFLPPLIDRDSNSVSVIAGIRGEITPVIRGRLAVGILHENFKNPIFKDFSRFTFDTNVEWLVTALTNISARAKRGVNNSALLASPAFVKTEYKLRVDHELLRNLIVSAKLEREYARFREIPRREHGWQWGVNATWLMGPHMRGYAGAEYRDRRVIITGVTDGPHFKEGLFNLGVRFQL